MHLRSSSSSSRLNSAGSPTYRRQGRIVTSPELQTATSIWNWKLAIENYCKPDQLPCAHDAVDGEYGRVAATAAQFGTRFTGPGGCLPYEMVVV